MKSNFYIRENKIYDLENTEIIPDDNGIIKVILYGYERRFKADRFINFLEMNNYTTFFKSPLKPKKIRVKKEKPVKVKIPKVKPVKVPKEKKPQRKCKCGVVISGKFKCRKCFESTKKVYQKVEFDKRCNNGSNTGFSKTPISCSNGKIYESMTKCAQELNITKSTIWNICNKKWKTSRGLTFNYL